MQICCFSSHFCPLILTWINSSHLQQLLLLCLPNGDFLFLIASIFIDQSPFVRNHCIFSPLFIFFNDIFMSLWIQANLLYSMVCNPILSSFYCNCPDFSIRSLFLLDPISYQCGSSVFEHLLIFWHHMTIQADFVFSQPQIWNQPFSQGFLIVFTGKWYLEPKILAIDLLIVLVVSLFLVRFSTIHKIHVNSDVHTD